MASFTKYHLAISKDLYLQKQAENLYINPLPSHEMNILETKPDYGMFSLLLERTGGPWGWTRRPRYAEGNRQSILKLLGAPETRLFLLRDQQDIVGYCLTAAPSFQNDLRKKFNQYAVSDHNVIEIENFGLFPEYTGKGYGRYFLPTLFEELLKDHDTVYLSTRGTNHPRVVPFYESLGMRVIHQETLPDDLIPSHRPQWKPPLYGT